MKKIIVVLLCLSPLLCFALCDYCAERSSYHDYRDGVYIKLCSSCYIQKSAAGIVKTDLNDFGGVGGVGGESQKNDFSLRTFVRVVVVIAVVIAVVIKVRQKSKKKSIGSSVDNDPIRLFSGINNPFIFLAPHIPVEKLDNALKSYAPEVKADDVILLVDDTMFGGAKKGMIVTQNKLFCKVYNTGPRKTLALSPQIKIQKSGKRIIVDGKDFCKFDMLDSRSLTKLVVAIREMCKICDISSQNGDNCNQNTAENVVNKCSFVFPCPHCNCKLESDTEWIGMECECPQCQKKIVIPQND